MADTKVGPKVLTRALTRKHLRKDQVAKKAKVVVTDTIKERQVCNLYLDYIKF